MGYSKHPKTSKKHPKNIQKTSKKHPKTNYGFFWDVYANSFSSSMLYYVAVPHNILLCCINLFFFFLPHAKFSKFKIVAMLLVLVPKVSRKYQSYG